jgi:hypothetical protein
MKRERAKELLPIIQAYADGKKIQYKVVNQNDWHDVDDEDGINEGLRYEYRIKPSDKYNEIFKLKSLLEENHIPFEWIEHNDYRNGYQICYPEKDEKCVCSVIEHSFSYGNEKDLLEIQGLLTAEEECDSVLGNLTADDVFQRILSHWNGTKEKTTYRPFKSCNELVYYWEQEKVGYSVNPLVMTDIWVKHKVDGRRRMIVGFGDNFVEVGVKAKPITLERLFEMYTFLDGSLCGVIQESI